MTLIFSDAMDSHGVTANLPDTYNSVTGGITYLSSGGRFGGGGIQVLGEGIEFTKTFSTIVDLYVSFALNIEFFGAGGGHLEIEYSNLGGANKVVMDTIGNLVLFVGANQVASFPITVGVWHWISMHFRVHATLGKWTVTVDGIQLVDFSGDTLATGTADTTNGVSFGAQSGSGTNPKLLYDDIIITDGIGSAPFNGLLVDRRMETIRPDGAGTSTQFAPFPADAVNWDKVDDVTPDDDTTYVEDSVSAQRDTYTHTNMTLTPATIDGLVVKTLTRNPDGGSNDIKHVINSSASISVGSAIGTTNAFQVKQTLFETDPNTAVAWVKAGVDAVEAGFEVA